MKLIYGQCRIINVILKLPPYKSKYKVYVYIIRHNYVLGGTLFSICKAQLHVSAINVGHLQVVQ